MFCYIKLLWLHLFFLVQLHLFNIRVYSVFPCKIGHFWFTPLRKFCLESILLIFFRIPLNRPFFQIFSLNFLFLNGLLVVFQKKKNYKDEFQTENFLDGYTGNDLLYMGKSTNNIILDTYSIITYFFLIIKQVFFVT